MESLFEVIAETDEYLVINKTGDIVCHPTKGDEYSSLIGRLRLYFGHNPKVHPSFVNRLDRETSGVVLVAKSGVAHANFQRAFESRKVVKKYYAIVEGSPKLGEGLIDQPLAREAGSVVIVKQAIVQTGAPSKTRWRLVSAGERFSLLEVTPETGRLHQIRVHLASIDHAIVGDKIYGPDPRLYLQFIEHGWSEELAQKLHTSRQQLHACELKIILGDGQKLEWRAPMPQDMVEFLAREVPSYTSA